MKTILATMSGQVLARRMAINPAPTNETIASMTAFITIA
jgi:hypothetical protein